MRKRRLPDWTARRSRNIPKNRRQTATRPRPAAADKRGRRSIFQFALHRDRAAVFLDDEAGDGQPQAGAFLFGGEKNVQQAREIFRGDAAAGVGEGQMNLRPAGNTLRLHGVFRGEHHLRRHRQAAFAVHRLEGVQEKIDEGLAQLLFVHLEPVVRGEERAVQLDVERAQPVLHQSEEIFHDGVQPDKFQDQPGRAGHAQDPRDNGIDALDFAEDQCGHFIVAISFERQFREGLDRDERVLYLVGRAGRERAQAGQAVEMPQTGLHALEEGGVLKNQQHGRASLLFIRAARGRGVDERFLGSVGKAARS